MFGVPGKPTRRRPHTPPLHSSKVGDLKFRGLGFQGLRVGALGSELKIISECRVEGL